MQQAVKWQMKEFTANTKQTIENPFWDVEAAAVLAHEASGTVQRVNGFYDGVNDKHEHVWRFRWNPPEAGRWQCRIGSAPQLDGLDADFEVQVAEAHSGAKGMMRAHAGVGWGFSFDNGEPYFLMGDTIYNFFGGFYNGVDMGEILRHRKSQGVNYIRVRMQVSPENITNADSWHSMSCWPWGGSPQSPDFTKFNLDYFRSVDQAMALMTELGMGAEIIHEAWLLEFPFNDRSRFLTEHEEQWIQYIVSRYSAYPSMYVWCPVNEYDLYPGNTEKKHLREAGRWFKRLAARIKSIDPHRHPVGVHQWGHEKPLHELMGDCGDIDIYLVQSDWFKEIQELNRDPSLCLWIEDNLTYHVPRRDKAAMCSEFGYERAGNLFTVDVHEQMDEHHTRRGMWKTGFTGFPVVHGFNNTWGRHLSLEQDSLGARFLMPYTRFMTEELAFYEMAVRPELVEADESMEELQSPALCLANDDLSTIAVYFPVAGTARLQLDSVEEYHQAWFNPRTGEMAAFTVCTSLDVVTPSGAKALEESDWALVLRKS